MARNKYIVIDGVTYPVAIIELKRKADILDKSAYRSEDGELHREVIGTFYNYSLKIGVINDEPLYNTLFWVLSQPVASHKVKFPHDNVEYDAYFSSVQDDIVLITDTGFKAKGLTCNCTGMRPRVKPGDKKPDFSIHTLG